MVLKHTYLTIDHGLEEVELPLSFSLKMKESELITAILNAHIVKP
jgi:hypothetical protein